MKQIDLKKLTRKYLYPFQRFHKKTTLSAVPQNELMPDELPKELQRIYYKSYPRLPELLLPKPKRDIGSLQEALLNRRSANTFSKKQVSLSAVSTLLYYSTGINTETRKNDEGRFYPSGGMKYPLETYLISLNTELPQGIYHYYIPDHALEELMTIEQFDFKKAFTKFNQTWIENAAFIIVTTAIFERSHLQYGERSYRLIHLEAGYMGQNMYLVSGRIGLGCRAAAGIVDSYFEELLDIDKTQEIIINTHVFGKKSVRKD